VYTDFFGLNEKPFSISPDPRYLYLSRRHADALAHLIYGISESGGFIQLTGEVGTGKTTLVRSLLEQLPDKAEIALILNPQLSKREFLESICEELRIPLPAEHSTKSLIDSLNMQLLRANAKDRRIVLIVDEAQTLSPELLEQVRLLTNLETAKKKLLQIILIGQPELREILDRPEMRQVAQRITGRYHLEPLSAQETGVYVKHRMKVAGAHRDVFTPAALNQLFKESGGIPRLINVVADRALLAAYTRERSRIDRALIREAAREVFGRRTGQPWWPWAVAAVGIGGLAIASVLHRGTPEDESPVAEVAELDTTPAAAAVTVEAEPAVDDLAVEAPIETLPVEANADVGLAELLATKDFPTDAGSAIRELFTIWGAEYDVTRGMPCSQAVEQGLACLNLTRGSFGELRTLNRPAVLTLIDATGDRHRVAVAQLGYDTAEIRQGGRARTVTLTELAHYWYGENMLLWRPVFAETADLIPGSRNESVPWLRDSLQTILGKTIPGSDPLLYDERLAEEVRAFQRRQKLSVDGVVGAQTQIAIQTALHMPNVPLLSEAR
jgi:general secretion pathway protein A